MNKRRDTGSDGDSDQDGEPVCETTAGFPVIDGPLVGEFHSQGDRFRFDGQLIGKENGTYYLLDGEYFWQADRDVIKIRPE